MKWKKIKKIKAKDTKKRCDSSSKYSNGKSYYGSSLSNDINWDEYRQPGGRRKINGLYHLVTNDINKNKYQHNDAIENEPKFDSSSNLSSGTKDPYQ